MRTLLAILLMTLCRSALAAETVQLPGPHGVTLRATVYRPAGPARGPAIVALHGCGGPFPSRDAQWGAALAAEGHVVLFPDSFGSRGLASQCRNADRTVTPGRLRREDAWAAAAWLAAQPGTPPGGVVLLGWSNGGSTVLAAGRERPGAPVGLIRGLVAFYPGCSAAARNPDWRPLAPLLIVMGEADDWTPAAPCHALADRLHGQVTLVTYPGAYHDFDAPDRPVRIRHGLAYTAGGQGNAHVGTDPAARADALRHVPAFIDALPPLPANQENPGKRP